MATASPSQAARPLDLPERRFLIRDIGWDGYEMLLDAFGDDGPRMNYLRGDVELMSPLIPHERPRLSIGYIIQTITLELDIPMDPVGSTTFKRPGAEAGLEADETYYLYANAGVIPRGVEHVDLNISPPPNLAVEVEWTNPLLAKLDIYAGIGVPEVWKFARGGLAVLLLGPDGSYTESPTSRAFPFLPMAEVARWIDAYDPAHGTRWRRDVQMWVREVLLPLYRDRLD